MDGLVASLKNAWTWLPDVTGFIGAVFGALLSVIQLYESRTFQHWKNNWLTKYRARKLARLQRRAKITAARIQALETIKTARKEARCIVEAAVSETKSITESTALASAIEVPSSHS